MDRVDDTADRVRSNVRAKTSRIVGIVRGARVALEHILSRAAEAPRPEGHRAQGSWLTTKEEDTKWQMDTIATTTKVVAAAAS